MGLPAEAVMIGILLLNIIFMNHLSPIEFGFDF
jgi:hypothetical protein